MRKLFYLFLLPSLNAMSQNVHYEELSTINTVNSIEKIQALASEINVCAFSMDERYLATFDMLFNFHIWDIQNNRIKNHLTDTINPYVVYDIEYFKNRELLIAAGDEIRIYETQRYHLVKRILSTPIYTVATGSKFFFTCGEDGMIRMWDINKMTLVDSADNLQSTRSIRLSHSENKLYAGSSSGFIKVYNVDMNAGKIHFADSIKAYNESIGIRKHEITEIDITEKDDYLLVNPDINAVYVISIANKSIAGSVINPDKSMVLSVHSIGNSILAAALESNRLLFFRLGDKIQQYRNISFSDCNIKDYSGAAKIFTSRSCRYIAFTNGLGIIHIMERK